MQPSSTAPAWSALSRTLAEIEDVRLAFLFGSRARGRCRPTSDYDIAVLLTEPGARADRGQVLRRLAGLLGRQVPSTLLDLVILNDAPPLLRHRVLRDGVLLFQRSPEDRVRFGISTIRDYQDGHIRRAMFTDRRIQRLKAGTDHGGPGDLLEKARSAARLLGQTSRVSPR